MILSRLTLRQFRSYENASFTFSDHITVILGPNAIGKSNIIESVYLLATGKSYRAEQDQDMVRFGEAIARVRGEVVTNEEEDSVEVVIVKPEPEHPEVPITRAGKRFFLNDVPKRRLDFAGRLKVLLFEPTDLDIISGPPLLRRRFLDQVLEQTDMGYARAILSYAKALRQRNALLEQVQEAGYRDEDRFSYWDSLLIGYGQEITQKREGLIHYLNKQAKELIHCQLVYDKSTISEERLLQYRDAEAGSGVTLVGPHRDDFQVYVVNGEEREARLFASRGQQRLIVLQLKLLERVYMEETLKEKPLLLLDDIFSELDEAHITHVLKTLHGEQVILTTTHEEFLGKKEKDQAHIIELGK